MPDLSRCSDRSCLFFGNDQPGLLGIRGIARLGAVSCGAALPGSWREKQATKFASNGRSVAAKALAIHHPCCGRSTSCTFMAN